MGLAGGGMKGERRWRDRKREKGREKRGSGGAGWGGGEWVRWCGGGLTMMMCPIIDHTLRARMCERVGKGGTPGHNANEGRVEEERLRVGGE